METLAARYRKWTEETAREKRRLARLVEKALRQKLSQEEAEKVWIFGTCVWSWKKPHYRSDIDLAVDDRDLDPKTAWKLGGKVLDVAAEFFGEDFVDVCFFSEISEELQKKILSYGRRIANFEGVGVAKR